MPRPRHVIRTIITRIGILLCLLGISLSTTSCKGGHQPTSAEFVGKWKSSKLETPVYLFDNGEWEIKTEDGGILQYGIWEYRDGRIIWSFKRGSEIGRDVDPVLSVNDQEFTLREGAAVTTFVRLERLAATH